MRHTFALLSVVLVSGFLTSGCANVERKFGRGMSNTFEIVRGGEFRRSMEQSAVLDSPDVAYNTGFIHGINRTLGRTGIGIWEMVTAPFPPYDPIFTDTFAPGAVYQDNHINMIAADPIFERDAYVGFSGGEIVPMLPFTSFRVFDNQ